MDKNPKFWEKTFNLYVKKFIQNKTSLFLEKDGQEIDFDKDIALKCLELLNGLTTMNDLHEKLKNTQNDENYVKFYSLLWHCYYIMYIMGPTSKKFLPDLMTDELKIKEKTDETILFIDEYASTKEIFSSNTIRPFHWGSAWPDLRFTTFAGNGSANSKRPDLSAWSEMKSPLMSTWIPVPA